MQSTACNPTLLRTNMPCEQSTNWCCPTTFEQQSKSMWSMLNNRDCLPCPPSMQQQQPWNQWCQPQQQWNQQWNQQQWCQPQQQWNQQWNQQQWCQPQQQWNQQQWCQPQQQWNQQQWNQQQQQWCGPEQCCNNSTLCNMPCRPCCYQELCCLTNPIRMMNREGDRCLCLCFDMRSYKPEEINVTFNRGERCLTIEGNQDCKESKEHQVQRKYCRKYCLPECLGKCDVSKCEPKCWLDCGYLNIEMQLPRMTSQEMQQIPTCQYPGQYGCFTPVNCKTN